MPTSDEIKEMNTALRTEVADLGDKVAALTASNDALVESNKKLTSSDTNQRRGIIALTVGGFLLLCALGAVVYAMVQLDHTSDRLDRQQQDLAAQAAYDVAACERANEQRAAHRQQWQDAKRVLSKLSQNDPLTVQLATELVKKADKNYPPLDCKAAVNPIPTPGATP
jgi:uncharacterized membrane protein